MSTVLSFRPTADADLDTVLSMEQDSENRPFIRQWPRQQHLDTIEDVNMAHLIVPSLSGDILGYVILAGLQNPDRSVEFKRIVIGNKADGIGRQAVRQIKRLVFEEYGAHRLWLEVMPHNERACNLYQSEGFVLEGTHRESLRQGDGFVSLDVMSILEREYGSWNGKHKY